MSVKSVVISASLMLLETARAAIVQQPLPASHFGAPADASAILAQLKASVGNRVLHATPVAWPCYHPEEYNSAHDCYVVEKSKTDNSWLSDQPGGYYYVRKFFHVLQFCGRLTPNRAIGLHVKL